MTMLMMIIIINMVAFILIWRWWSHPRLVKGIKIASLTVTDLLPSPRHSVILTLGHRNKVSPHTQSPGQTYVQLLDHLLVHNGLSPQPENVQLCKAIFSLKPGGQFKWQPLGDNFEGRGWQDDAIAATAKPEAAKGSDYTMITLITGHRGHKDASCEHILNQTKSTSWKILS